MAGSPSMLNGGSVMDRVIEREVLAGHLRIIAKGSPIEWVGRRGEEIHLSGRACVLLLKQASSLRCFDVVHRWNQICRLHVRYPLWREYFTMLAKRAAAGRLPLQEAAKSAADQTSGPFAAEFAVVRQAKKAVLFVLGAAIQEFGDAFRDEQEILMHTSDMVMETYAMDTAVHRLMKKGSTDIHADAVRTFINDAVSRVEFSGRQALAAIPASEARYPHIEWAPINTVRIRQRIAEYLTDHGRYAL